MLILPYDPDAERLATEGAVEQLNAQRSVDVGNGTIHFGSRVIPTAHATALVTQFDDDMPWQRYVAIHRNGAVELGLGGQYRPRTDSNEVSIKLVRLVTATSFTWATLELARRIGPEVNDLPHQLTVALPDTAGALLSNLATGYEEPGSRYNRMPGCPDDHLLWHIELERLPADSDEANAVALSVASRITNAWGTSQTFYLDRDGDAAGQLNVRRARQ
ncbi:MAG: hypothetical protein F4190_13760 [Acidimicrobiales bacterium]|nr:hypothetical protein [Acidimicrobiales bacterium]